MTVFGKKKKKMVCTFALWLWLLIFFFKELNLSLKKNRNESRHVLNVGAGVGRRQLCDLEAGTWSNAVATCLPCGCEEVVTQ